MNNSFIELAIRFAHENYTPIFNDSVIDRVCIGPSMCAVLTTSGHCGLSGMERQNAQPISVRNKLSGPFSPGHYKGLKLRDLLMLNSDHPFANPLRIAALNALTAAWHNRFSEKETFVVHRNTDPVSMVEQAAYQNVAIIGAFCSYIKLFEQTNCKLSVIELRPEAFAPEHLKFYVPYAEAAKVLPSANLIIITASAITNNTLPHVLTLRNADAATILVGPSGGFTPELFFAKDISHIGCVRVNDADAVMSAVSEGAFAYHLFNFGAEKITLSHANAV